MRLDVWHQELLIDSGGLVRLLAMEESLWMFRALKPCCYSSKRV